MKTPNCCDKIPPSEYKHGDRRNRVHAWEDWGIDYRHLICGHEHRCHIWVCTRELRPAQGGGICGHEKAIREDETP